MPHDIDAALHTWQRWAFLRADAGLGYSKVTLLARVIEQGPAGAAIRQDYASRFIPTDATAERIDALVAGLPDHLRDVVTAEYLGRGSRKQHAKRLHLSYDAFTGRLKRAKGVLAAEL